MLGGLGHGGEVPYHLKLGRFEEKRVFTIMRVLGYA
jgi:hypothetical protein